MWEETAGIGIGDEIMGLIDQNGKWVFFPNKLEYGTGRRMTFVDGGRRPADTEEENENDGMECWEYGRNDGDMDGLMGIYRE